MNVFQALELGILMLQALVVLGGGFYFVGRLSERMTSLSHSIEHLAESHRAARRDQEERIGSLEQRVARLEAAS